MRKVASGFFPVIAVDRKGPKNTAIVQVAVSYDKGITLSDGDRIPPFSEIHRLALVKVADTWRISAKDDASGAEELLELQDAAR